MIMMMIIMIIVIIIIIMIIIIKFYGAQLHILSALCKCKK